MEIIDKNRLINIANGLEYLGLPASPEIAQALLSYHGLDPEMTVVALFDIASETRAEIAAEHQEMLANTASARTKLLITTAVLSKYQIVNDNELNQKAEDLARPLVVNFDSSQLARELCNLLVTAGFIDHYNSLQK